MKNYSIEELDAMTELVTKIRVNLIDEGCSFDEACKIAKAIPVKLASGEITKTSLKDSLPNLLEQVRAMS
ncbi:hypothetical protein H6G80_30700 [Nostoc sp. FACHB-87]|uniref:hypothetical protein n=1 Tax=Nostocaceae TaxID=1162 RepID=UPI001682DA5D|nr:MULTISPECIES: hypothetical protein [Nostocaceae]MBD2458424.1 hypothetical protein [Nostoc sp. FACHB-87]MBD2479480.1 hypothetical protein [Anabaena sp. FACHB-83]